MKCEVCGIDFEPCKSTAKWQKTCSKKCRRVRNNREHAEYLKVRDEYGKQRNKKYADKYKESHPDVRDRMTERCIAFNKEQSTRSHNFVIRVKMKFGCLRCGYKKCPSALSFHHTGVKGRDISSLVSRAYSMSAIKAEMRTCIILCMNCHQVEHKLCSNTEISIRPSKKPRIRNRKFITRVKVKFGCSTCGYKECGNALSFHHIGDKRKEVAHLASQSCSIATIKTEIRQCIVLCMNCHQERHYYEDMKE